MFTADNSEFDTEARAELNKALKALLADADEDMYAHLEKSYSNLLNNAWHEGITADELIKAVRN